jgi:hypothetical protein
MSFYKFSTCLASVLMTIQSRSVWNTMTRESSSPWIHSLSSSLGVKFSSLPSILELKDEGNEYLGTTNLNLTTWRNQLLNVPSHALGHSKLPPRQGSPYSKRITKHPKTAAFSKSKRASELTKTSRPRHQIIRNWEEYFLSFHPSLHNLIIFYLFFLSFSLPLQGYSDQQIN